MKLTCPFCQNSFEPLDIIFCTDATNHEPFTPRQSEVKTSSDDDTMFTQRMDSADLAGGRVRTKAMLTGLESDETTKGQEDKTDKIAPDVFGKPTQDVRLKRFMKNYGEGKLFVYDQTATYYRVTTDKDLALENSEYGWVEEPAVLTEDTVPLKIYVPTRAEKRSLTIRVCPHCHCEMPVGFFETTEANHHVAALAGCSGAGKTQYIIAALRELQTELDALCLGSVDFASCSMWFLNMYIKMYENNSIESTKKEFLLFPLILRVRPKGGKDPAFITIYDCAGEYSTDSDYAANLVGLCKADVLLLMMDPSQFWRDITKVSQGERKCTSPFAQALSPIREYKLCPNLKKIVAVLTKLDTIMYDTTFLRGDSATAKDGHILHSHDMSVHRNGVNMQIVDSIHDELNAVFAEHGRPGMANEIKTESGDDNVSVSLLGVSTYCWEDNQLVNRPKQETGRHRIIEPLLLSMAFWNILATKIDMPQEYTFQHSEPRVGFWRKLFGRA